MERQSSRELGVMATVQAHCLNAVHRSSYADFRRNLWHINGKDGHRSGRKGSQTNCAFFNTLSTQAGPDVNVTHALMGRQPQAYVDSICCAANTFVLIGVT